MLHASSAGGDASSAGDAVRGRLRALFPRFFADGAIGVAAERAFMHQGGEVDEAAVQEAHRALMAMNHLGVVLAKVKHRDVPTARLVVVAIAVHRGLFRRDDGTLDLKKAFTTIYGPWQSTWGCHSFMRTSSHKRAPESLGNYYLV